MKPWHHLYNWLTSPWQRARRAEWRLAQQESAVILLRLRIDDTEVACYSFNAYRLESAGPWSNGPVWSQGHLSTFTIETNVEILMGLLPSDADPGLAWRCEPDPDDS